MKNAGAVLANFVPINGNMLRRSREMLLAAEKINHGNNAVIARIEASALAPELAAEVAGKDPRRASAYALKLIKAHLPGTGRQEFESQRAAQELVEGREGLALVPRIYGFMDLPIRTDEQREHLETRLGFLSAPRNVEVLLMDLVDGTDLYTVLAREVLRRHPDSVFREQADALEFDALHHEVGVLLGFVRPAGKHRNADAKAFEAQTVYAGNARKVFDFLRKIGFVLDPKVRPTLARTIAHLHDRGFYHRDLHMRNAMVGREGQVYLIDFGTAFVTGRDGRAGEDNVYLSAGGKRFGPDEEILADCAILETSIEEERRREATPAGAELRRLRTRIEQDARAEVQGAWLSFQETLASHGGELEPERIGTMLQALRPATGDAALLLLAGAILEIAVRDPCASRTFLERELPGGSRNDAESRLLGRLLSLVQE